MYAFVPCRLIDLGASITKANYFTPTASILVIDIRFPSEVIAVDIFHDLSEVFSVLVLDNKAIMNWNCYNSLAS